jgi:hypothetical protein
MVKITVTGHDAATQPFLIQWHKLIWTKNDTHNCCLIVVRFVTRNTETNFISCKTDAMQYSSSGSKGAIDTH